MTGDDDDITDRYSGWAVIRRAGTGSWYPAAAAVPTTVCLVSRWINCHVLLGKLYWSE